MPEDSNSLRRRIERQEKAIRRLEERLLAIENSQFFRLIRWPGRFLLGWKIRLGQVLLRSPLHPLYLKLAQPRCSEGLYRQWIAPASCGASR